MLCIAVVNIAIYLPSLSVFFAIIITTIITSSIITFNMMSTISTIIPLIATTLTCDRYGLSMSGNERVLCKKESAKRGEMFTPREKKFVTVKLVKKLVCNIRCCSVMLCCVNACDSSIWAPSRHSVLPHRLLCHNKITGGLLDSSSPQGLLLTFFFFAKFGAATLKQFLAPFLLMFNSKDNHLAASSGLSPGQLQSK